MLGILFACETISTSDMVKSTHFLKMSHVEGKAKSCFRATNYYLPDQDADPRFKSCAKTEVVKFGKHKVKVCSKFLADVKLQGSGQLNYHGKKYRLSYTGKMEPVATAKCSTTVGAANKCLIPYIHVAADPAHFNMGDIIEVPELKYMRIPRPDGKGDFIHPGYFIVGDTGGDIKGNNRFDFFVGKRFPLTKENPFGPWGKKMTDENNCIMSFKRISKKANPVKAQRLARSILASVSTGETLVAATQPEK